MEQPMHRQGGSVGGVKIYILAAMILAAGVFVASKFGPHFQTKWELEDKMEDVMKRLVRVGEEGIFDELQLYVDEQKLGFNVYDNCTFSGEVGGAAKWVCTYDVNIGLPKYPKYRMTAIATSSKLPVSSF
jgi:hypothetical protein